MEKRHKIETVDGEIPLPEAIIQRIQSLLNRQQAAQTTSLSKSWYTAWSTRPNLDFDQHHFGGDLYNCGDEHVFWESAKNIMHRYEKSNLKIDNFRLCMETTITDRTTFSKELIVKALKMGATDVEFELRSQNPKFVIPSEVIESETLAGLSVIGCRINLGADRKVNCQGLKSLSLCRVFTLADTIWDIILSCPLLENLTLSECKWLSKVQPPIGFKADDFEFRRPKNGSFVNTHITPYGFHKLKCLRLEKVKINAVFFREFSSNLPCLKDLSLNYCVCNKTIRVPSTSLEFLSLAHSDRFKAVFDVPSIRKFTLSVFGTIPTVYFRGTPGEWESDVFINWIGYEAITSSWFLKLRKFLENFCFSKVSLSLFHNTVDYDDDIQGLPELPVVENLVLSFYELNAPFLKCLLLACRPKFITVRCLGRSCTGFVGEANSAFLQLVSDNWYVANDKTEFRLLGDLKEVNVEFFEESLAEWRPLPLKALLDAPTRPAGNKRKIRFKLGWGI
ncbi:putative F-box/LRR-repeat protein at4g00320 [Phtheirospermum japonicum]|uniref:Putative F-box/LRR-repeat protein at4g00320 n=1 Tax=Phtheirospermum japonicum TaxID=374723 RepID=A0A830BRE3_9LAMI|nr:putative F-box/LRR-repeat protein at4g00320 [Phtheirospermum japonicum]